MNTAESQTQWTNSESVETCPKHSFSGKTSPASSQQRTTHSDASLEECSDLTLQSSPSEESGGILETLLESDVLRGDCSMLNTSEWPNDAVVCLLSQQLAPESVQPADYLSAEACRGLLRRAEKRGRPLPPMLKRVLELQAVSECAKDVRGGVREPLSETKSAIPCKPETTRQSSIMESETVR